MTTTETLPKETRDAGYFLPEPLAGGPKFAFGGNVGEIDFSVMSPTTAANMLAHGIGCLAKRETPARKGSDITELGEADEATSVRKK